MVPNADFQLSDLLRQRGVISPLDGELKQAVRLATENYLLGAEELISTLTKVSPRTAKSSPNGRRKEGKAIGVSGGDSGSESGSVGANYRTESTT